MCTHMHIHAYSHTHTHAYTYTTHTHARAHAHTHAYSCAHTCARMCTHTHICARACAIAPAGQRRKLCLRAWLLPCSPTNGQGCKINQELEPGTCPRPGCYPLPSSHDYRLAGKGLGLFEIRGVVTNWLCPWSSPLTPVRLPGCLQSP